MTTPPTTDPLAALELALHGLDYKLRVRVLQLVLAAEYAVWGRHCLPHSKQCGINIGGTGAFCDCPIRPLAAALADLKDRDP